MPGVKTQQQLYSLEQASQALGNVSPWLLRKHIYAGRIKVTRIGTRVFIPDEEICRLAKEGLPSLRPVAVH
jgi:predicted site-specific integrase-resolvase